MKIIESSEVREGITVGFENFIVVGTKKEEKPTIDLKVFTEKLEKMIKAGITL
jgi:adenosylcobinamide amidohydrolase